MRLLIILVVTLGMTGQAAANQPVSGVVAVSTGPVSYTHLTLPTNRGV